MNKPVPLNLVPEGDKPLVAVGAAQRIRTPIATDHEVVQPPPKLLAGRLRRVHAFFAENDRMVQYVANQEAHHEKESFQEELVQLLTDAGVPFDRKYLN